MSMSNLKPQILVCKLLSLADGEDPSSVLQDVDFFHYLLALREPNNLKIDIDSDIISGKDYNIYMLMEENPESTEGNYLMSLQFNGSDDMIQEHVSKGVELKQIDIEYVKDDLSKQLRDFFDGMFVTETAEETFARLVSKIDEINF